jgi:hypothetical protein
MRSRGLQPHVTLKTISPLYIDNSAVQRNVMPLPLPLYGIKGADVHAGTGFLVVAGSYGWLVTCAHLITGLRETPPKRSLFAGGRIQVLIPLFQGSIQRFTAATCEADGNLFDVIAIGLTSSEAAALSGFGMHDMATIRPPVVGEPVTATGFPGLGSALIDPATVSANIEQVVGASVKLDRPSIGGLSGSALMSENGLVGIVHGDVGEAPDLTNGLAISFAVIGSELFK